MRIDNRTTYLKVLNRPEGVATSSLQSYFQNFGSIESVELLEGEEGTTGTAAPAVVKFAHRRGAENAKANAKYLGSHLLSLEWYDPRSAAPAAPALVSSSSSTSTTTAATPAAASSSGVGGESAEGDGEEGATGMEQQEVDELDALLFQGQQGATESGAAAEEAMAVEGNGVP